LAQNAIDDEGAKALSTSDTLMALKYLEIFGNALTEEGITALKESKAFPNIQILVAE